MAEKLRKWLVEISCQPVSGLGNVPIPLQQARALLDEVQVCLVCLKKEEKNPHLLYSLHNFKHSLKCIRFRLSALQKAILGVSSSLELASLRSNGVMEMKLELIKNIQWRTYWALSLEPHLSSEM